MSRALSRRLSLPTSVAGLLLAVLALVSQLALGSMVLPDAPARTQQSALDALSVMCGSGVPASSGQGAPQGAPHHRNHADGALCPLSVALALPAIVLTPAPLPPLPAAVPVRRLPTPESARGPPSHDSHLGFPRGPPILA